MKYFFTADEHYGHAKIIGYCNRPFATVEEMNSEIIKRHNEVVKADDMVFHIGDFTLGRDSLAYRRRLNGHHVFIKGSHDYWMEDISATFDDEGMFHEMFSGDFNKNYIVMCHYAMRVWPKSHYGSWQLYGHSHGKLPGIGKQMDVGVDTHDFYPYSLEEIEKIMAEKEDNPNWLKKNER